jgi:DNA-binding winged helix-turn-helix (wHTH) protein/tetratricopeptide (TPR) repeat protein
MYASKRIAESSVAQGAGGRLEKSIKQFFVEQLRMSVYRFGPFQLDAGQLLLTVGAVPVPLGPKVVETLLALIEHPGEVLSKNAILDRVWPEGFVEEANLAQNVYVLRKVLRSYWNADVISTVPRHGYRFVSRVEKIEVGHPEPVVAADVKPRVLRGWGRAGALATAAILCVAVLGFAVLGVARDRAQAEAPPQLSAQGARLYEIGRYYWNQRTPSGVRKSLDYFAQVVDSDPRNALGYAAMADSNAIMGDYHFGPLPTRVYFSRARAYAQKALALDPRSAEAYALLGMLDNAAAMSFTPHGLAALRHAIALNPSYGPAHQWLGAALLSQGHPAEAMRELQIAVQLDPLSVPAVTWLSSAAYLDRHYDDAIAYARQTLDLSPRRSDALAILGMAYEGRGDYPHAIAAFERMGAACSTCGPEAAALLADVYAVQHNDAKARAEIQRAQADPHDVAAEDVAIALAAMGDRPSALAWFHRVNKTYERPIIALDPRLDALRTDSRFRDFTQGPA